jgi:hypothetical protein
MDFTGRPSAGMVFVAPEGLGGAAQRRWVEKAAVFVRTLRPKLWPRRELSVSFDGAPGGSATCGSQMITAERFGWVHLRASPA